jgi:hypothetical protein
LELTFWQSSPGHELHLTFDITLIYYVYFPS